MRHVTNRPRQTLNEFLQDDDVALEVALQAHDMRLKAEIDRLEKRVACLEEQLSSHKGACKNRDINLGSALKALEARLEGVETRAWWRRFARP